MGDNLQICPVTYAKMVSILALKPLCIFFCSWGLIFLILWARFGTKHFLVFSLSFRNIQQKVAQKASRMGRFMYSSSLLPLLFCKKKKIFYEPIFFHITITSKAIKKFNYVKTRIFYNLFLFKNILVKKLVNFMSQRNGDI